MKKGMKKGWKIALISLGSLLGLVVLAVGIVLWQVFTPSQLTRIVNNLASRYVNCETHFERVDLTLFKTFPDAGLRIDEVYIVNPVEGAPSDTVARIGSLTVGVDVKRFLKEKEVVVHQVLLEDVQASLFVSADGSSNYDIFPKGDDDSTKSAFSLDSLPDIDLRKVKIGNAKAVYRNLQCGIDATVDDLDLALVGTLREGRVDADLDIEVDGIDLATSDSLGNSTLAVVLADLDLDLKAEGNLDEVDGKLKLNVENGRLNTRGTDMVNERLQASRHDLLSVTLPFSADLRQMCIKLDESRLAIDEYALKLQGKASLAQADRPMQVDVSIHNSENDPWQVKSLLEIVPAQFTKALDGMDVDAKVAFVATAVGAVSDSTMPVVRAGVTLSDGRFYSPKLLPYKINRVSADLDAILDMGKGGTSSVAINSFKAHTRNTDLSLTGNVDDLLGDMHLDVALKGSLPLEDAKPMLPDTLPVVADGKAALDLHADLKMSQLKAKAFDKMKANGTIKLRQLDVTYDSIHAVAPDLDVALQLPARKYKGKMAEVHVSGSTLKVDMNTIHANLSRPDINVGVNDITREQIAAAVELSLEKSVAALDSNNIDLSALSLSGSIRMDSTQDNILRKYNPSLDIDLRQTKVQSPILGEELYINNLDFHYTPELCDIADADIKLGNSDLQLYGSVENLEHWLSHEKMLTGELNLTSHYTDVDQLMDMFSGMGSNPDTLEQMREEDNVPKEANPFIVPRDVDFMLHTHLKRSLAFGNDLGDVAGSVTIKDGVAILDQIGFVCKAATMQLTALYKSPRPNNLFVALDFHLLDIQIDELLDMIPAVDTLVPMLAAFDGNANFHLAAETFLDARYQPKMSSLLGSAAISGRDLVVMDNSSISQIAKLMQFKSWKDKDNKIKIDSLDVELTCFRKEIEVYPFLINIGKYHLCASGKHTLDNQCGYHIELLKNPFLAKIGVDVRGNISKPSISLGQVRYADLYKPEKQGVVEKRTLELKRMIREALEANVR